MAAPTCGFVIVKRFTYRTNPTEEFSNKYWFTGATPADSNAWSTLFDALCLQEKTVYPSSVTIVRGYGYDDVSDTATAVWSKDLTVTPNTPIGGTMSQSGLVQCPGDDAVWVRWGLDRYNSKGKRVYLRKYFHPAHVVVGSPDVAASAQTGLLSSFGLKLRDGSFSGGRVITDKLGSAVVGHAVSSYVTTRTLKRRGKRPPT